MVHLFKRLLRTGASRDAGTEANTQPRMNEQSYQVADNLIEQHGIDGALDAVRTEIATAHANGDNYRLSGWREVRRVLQDKREAADNPDTVAI